MELEDWLKIGYVVTSRTEGNMCVLMILTLNAWMLNVESHRALYWGQHCLYCMLMIMCNVSKSLKSILFADDTNLFYAGKDLDEVCKIISRELNILHIILVSSK